MPQFLSLIKSDQLKPVTEQALADYIFENITGPAAVRVGFYLPEYDPAASNEIADEGISGQPRSLKTPARFICHPSTLFILLITAANLETAEKLVKFYSKNRLSAAEVAQRMNGDDNHSAQIGASMETNFSQIDFEII